MGTTGAAMLLIRPLLNANRRRHYQMHTYIFFIFIVANIAGSLTPLGDPPLFLGFLRGVTFFWTAGHLWEVTGLAVGLLLIIYFLLDTWLYKKELKDNEELKKPVAYVPFGFEGSVNFVLLACIVGVPCSCPVSGRQASNIPSSVCTYTPIPYSRCYLCDSSNSFSYSHEERVPRGQPVLLGTDSRSRQIVLRYFRNDRSGSGNAAQVPPVLLLRWLLW